MFNFLIAIKGAVCITVGLAYFSTAGIGVLYEPSWDVRLAVSCGFILTGIICLHVWHWLECKEHLSYMQDTFADDCKGDLKIHQRDSGMRDLLDLVRNPNQTIR